MDWPQSLGQEVAMEHGSDCSSQLGEDACLQEQILDLSLVQQSLNSGEV